MEKITTISEMNEMDHYIINLDPNKTILFFDIDNTLLRTKSDIGSVEWVRWQENLLKTYAGNHEHSVSDSFTGMYQLYQKWLTSSNCETELLEEYVDELIHKYIDMGFKVVLITARDKCTAETTFNQLSRHYDTNKFFSKDLYFKNDKILYQNGVYFATGIKKGDCIDKFLQIIKLIFDFEPENIVFIDDSTNECNNVASKFKNHNINAIVFNYLHGMKYQISFDMLDKHHLHKKWIHFNQVN
ncbi:hypothetical protein QJ856_gp0926 [Tupanvirus deep ocean]|uniref:Uncharacterized protein n=2 Tax=Tupanvirus TaxID=2094720 RepID=A0AC62A7U2_9VIRU|nr:hypothetical protein QJ856_gp0926 [Tupanvirus deep ocean]QKU33831.1 hypothetical protein [Tupanvirus deep ocean]